MIGLNVFKVWTSDKKKNQLAQETAFLWTIVFLEKQAMHLNV